MQKSKTPPQSLMKRVIYPFFLGMIVYIISSSLFFMGGFLLVFKHKDTLSSGLALSIGVMILIYLASFFLFGPLLTLAFAYQRSSIARQKGKQKNL